MSLTDSPLLVVPKPPRIAAVLILVYPRGGQAHVVFMERSQTLSNHAGQISLPGGSRDPSDPSLEFTALRETEEELGVPAHLVRVLGALGEVYSLRGSYQITPYVGLLDHEPLFRAQASEVAEVIEIPLAHLRDLGTLGEEEWEAGGTLRRNRFYGFGRHRIWGPTGDAVAAFLASDYPETAIQSLSLPY
jgi:8-oxo-dGTP pyrophosphatase MutT (NUDIX family)